MLDLTRLDVTDRVPVGDSQASGDSSILLAVNGTRGYEGSNDTSVSNQWLEVSERGSH